MRASIVRAVAAGALSVVTAGCSASVQPKAEPRPHASTSTAVAHPVLQFPGMPHADRAGFAVVGHGYAEVVSGGDVTIGAAWSTIKVPLSIAALKRGGSTTDVALAIEASQNPPADRLWDSLGTPSEAGRLTRAEIAAGGDTLTQVQTIQTYPPYSPYGQTTWSLVGQARFASSLPCRSDARSVYADMGHIDRIDQVGFGATAMAGQARYKIGWGPAAPPEQGSYARELAAVDLGGGRLYGVALIAHESTLARAQADLTDLAAWLGPHLTRIRARGC